MGTSNLDHINLSNIHGHPSNISSSSPTSHALENESQEDQTNIKENTNLASCALKIEVPSSTIEFKASNCKDDPTTPTSTEHIIPITGACPPAPRKARWVPTTRKRKEPYFPVVQVPTDFIAYMDAMLALNEVVYVPDIVVGDLGASDYAKRLKLLTPPQQTLD